MKRNIIKKLAEQGYGKSGINKDQVLKIAKALKRKDLKIFIKDLKNIEAKRTVRVTLPDQDGITQMRNYLVKVYPGKKILFNIDPTLLSGIKVEDFDNVYELSLKSFLNQAIINTKYD